MIDRFFIGLVTGWVSVLGPLGLRALAFRLGRAGHVPPIDPLPICRASGPSGHSSCILPLGHEPLRHRSREGALWTNDEYPPLTTRWRGR